MASPARRLIFAVVAPVQRFFRLEAAGGIVLFVAAVAALVLANSSLGADYLAVVQAPLRFGVGAHELQLSLHSLVDDGLMTVFFVVAGMEIKREIVHGELRTLRRAALPLVAAAGGMLVPALIYLALAGRSEARSGWAIPTATDIAFALGCLSIVRRRIPWSLFVFLTALAIFDDLGAILIIALAYGSSTSFGAMAVAAAIALALFAVGRSGIQRPWIYVVLGGALWVAIERAGLHPTLAGVVIGLAIPTTPKRSLESALADLDVALESLRQLPAARAEGSLAAIEGHVRALQAPSERLLDRLHGPVAFGIVPLFALANAGIVLVGVEIDRSVAFAVGAALVVGKCLGVLGGAFLGVRAGLAPLPTGARWAQVAGVALVAGIGFTMSLFVTALAFPRQPELALAAKLGIVTGSAVSSIAGLLLLRALPAAAEPAEPDVSVFHVDLPRFAEGYRVASWETTPVVAGRTLADLAWRRERGITVLGVFREQAVAADGTHLRKLEALAPTDALVAGDTLLIVGTTADVERFLADS